VPVGFAWHAWFVVNKRGEVSRYEIRHFKNRENPDLGYLYVNNQPPFRGVGVFRSSTTRFRPAKVLGAIEGGEGSEAQKAVEYIENSKETYPYCSRYSLIGPNSNTYVKRVLDKFSGFNVELSWRFVGKGYEQK
jgi:hypothetical protein